MKKIIKWIIKYITLYSLYDEYYGDGFKKRYWENKLNEKTN